MTIASSSRNSSPVNGGRDEPSAPSPGLLLFNSEELSDIVFLVGLNEDKWRIPAHSFVVADASRVFQEIIANTKLDSTREDQKPEIAVTCQPEVFHAMLRCVPSHLLPRLTLSPSSLTATSTRTTRT